MRRPRAIRYAVFAAVLLCQIAPASAWAAGAGDWLVIRTYAGTSGTPKETISVPLSLVIRAADLVPASVRETLAAEGISVDEIVRLVQKENLRGPIARIDDAKRGERVEIAIE